MNKRKKEALVSFVRSWQWNGWRLSNYRARLWEFCFNKRRECVYCHKKTWHYYPKYDVFLDNGMVTCDKCVPF